MQSLCLQKKQEDLLPVTRRFVNDPFEQCDRLGQIVFPEHVHAVVAEFVRFGLAICYCHDPIPCLQTLNVGDGCLHTEALSAFGIGCEGQCAVGQGKCDTTMSNAKAIEHVVGNAHSQAAEAFAKFQHFDAQPLTKAVVGHHFIDDVACCHAIRVWVSREFQKY